MACIAGPALHLSGFQYAFSRAEVAKCSLYLMYDGVVRWPGEDVGDELSGKRSNKQRRDDDADEETIGAFAGSRFSRVSEVEVLIIPSYSGHL
jgi:hypothetical protein